MAFCVNREDGKDNGGIDDKDDVINACSSGVEGQTVRITEGKRVRIT